KGKMDHIDTKKANINVPGVCWKVVMVLPRGEQPNKNTRAFAVLMTNTNEDDVNWAKYRVSVKKVEETTGLSFWPNLPTDIGEAIKSRIDSTHIPVVAFKGH